MRDYMKTASHNRFGKISIAFGAMALAGFVTFQADAAMAPNPFADMTALSDDDLQGLRGGMKIGGFEFNFSIESIVAVSQPDLPSFGFITRMTLDDAGHVATNSTDFFGNAPSSQTFGGGGGAPLSQVQVGAFGTQVMQRIAEDHLMTIIQNTADNVSIAKETNVDVVVPNFSQAAKTFAHGSMVRRLGTSIGLAGLGLF